MDEKLQQGDRTFISTTLASELTGYSQDYVGQLAREGNFESTKIGRRRYVDRNQFLKYAEENKKGFLISDLPNKHQPEEATESATEKVDETEAEEPAGEVSSAENKATNKEISDDNSISSEAHTGLKLANEDLDTSEDRPSSRWRLTKDKLRAVGSSNSKAIPSKLPAIAMSLILMTALGIAGLNILGSPDTADQSTSSAVVEEAPSSIEQLAGSAGELRSSAETPRENILLASANKAMESVSLAAAATTNFGESVLRPLRDMVVNTLYIGTASLLRIGDTFIADMPTYTPPEVELADSDAESEAATTPAPTAGNYSNRNDVLLVNGITQLTGIVARLAGSLEEDDSDSSLRAYVRDRVATLERQMYGNDDAVLDAADYDHPRDITLDSVDVGETTSDTLSVSGRTTLSATTSVDTDTLFVDVTNDRVGINTADPQFALDVVGTFRADTFVANSTSTATNFTASSTDTGSLTADTATITDLTVGNLTATSSADLATTTVTDLSASSTDTDSLTATNATATNFYTQNLTADSGDITDLTGENATITNATTTNFFASLANFTTAIISNLTATVADITNLTADNATTTQLTTGDLSATSSADLATTTITSLSASSTDTDSLTATNATTTNFFASVANFTTAVFDTITATLGDFTNLEADNATTTQLTAGDLSATSSADLATTTITDLSASSTDTDTLTAGDAILTNATTTNFVVLNDTVFGDTELDTLTVNATIESDLIPNSNATLDLGSPSFYWDIAYLDTINANNISAASTSISGTDANSFTLNTDNNTQDGESSDLIFYRGQVTPNAVIEWDNVADRFDFNQSIYIDNRSNSTTNPTIVAEATPGQTADLLQLASSSGDVMFSVGSDGSVTAPSASTTDITGTNATFTNATTTNFFASVANFTTAVFDTITATLGDFTNLEADNATTTNLVATDATTTNLTASGDSSLSTTTVAGDLSVNSGAVNISDSGRAGFEIENTGASFTNTFITGGIGNPKLFANWTLADEQSDDSKPTWGTKFAIDQDRFEIIRLPAGTSGDNGQGQLMVVDADGNVGIGTTTPAVTLDINATDAVRLPAGTSAQRPSGENGYIRYNSDNSQFEGFYAGAWQGLGGVIDVDQDTYITAEESSDEDYLRFYTDGSERVTVTNTGEVGIGTNNPGSALEVSGDAFFQSASDNSEAFKFEVNETNDQLPVVFENIGGGMNMGIIGQPGEYTMFNLRHGNTSGDGFNVGIDDSDPGDLVFVARNGANNEVARLTNSGDFGIGTNNPATTLDVAGTTTAQALSVGGDTITDFTGTGLTLAGSALTATLGTSISLGELDFDPIIETELDSESELESQLTDVSNVFTNNDGALDDDDLSDDDISALSNVSAGGASEGEIIQYDGANWINAATSSLGIVGEESASSSGAVQFSDGTGSFLGDANNFFWDNANNRLGIGTSTPADRLSIQGDSTSSGDYALRTTDSAGDTTFSVNNAGEVGIGTDAGGANSLTILRNNPKIILSDEGDQSEIANFFGNLNFYSDFDNNVADSNIGFHVDTADTDDAPKLLIDNTGNIGIGTIDPDERLHVRNTSSRAFIELDGGSSDQDTGIRFEAGNFAWEQYFERSPTTNMYWDYDGTEVMNLSSSGDLTVQGGFSFDGNLQLGSNQLYGSVSGQNFIEVYDGATGAMDFFIDDGGSSDDFRWQSNLGTLMLLESDTGELGIGTDTPANTLDVDGGIDANTLNTGQGDNELYAMDQNVQTTDTPTFAGLTVNGDTITDFTGTGLSVASNILNVDDVETLSTSLTSGSVVFSDGSSLAQDNANFFWDDNNNRLGIGTTTPSAILEIVGDGSTPYLRIGSGGGGTYAFEVDQNDKVSVGTGNDDIYFNTSGGTNVGVGTSSPTNDFTVVGDSYFEGSVDITSTTSVGAFTVGNDTITDITGTGLSVVSQGGGLGLSVDNLETISTGLSAGSIIFSDGSFLTQDSSNFFWDDTNDRLGIGTSTPSTQLEIIDNTGGSPINIYRSGSANIAYEVSNDDNSWFMGSTGGGYFSVGQDSNIFGNTDLTIDTDGNVGIGLANSGVDLSALGSGGLYVADNVGIGTTSPATTLDVAGTTTAQALSVGGDTITDFTGTNLSVSNGVLNASGGSGASAASSSGAVQFSDGAGNFLGDADNFFWDDANNRLGIGTTSPDSLAHLYNDSGDAQMRIESGDGNFSTIRFTEFNSGGVEYGSFIRNNGSSNLLEIGTVDSDTDFPLIYVPRGTEQVGIGTNNPATTLDVAGTTTAQALSVGGDVITDFTGSNLSVIGGTLHASDSDTTYTAGTGLNLSNEQFSIDSSVLQDIDIDTEAEFESALFEVLTPGEATTTFTGLTDTPSSYTTSAIPFANGAGDALSFVSDFVFDGANFGIGTSSPSASLTVVADGSTPRLRIESATSGTYALEVDENDQAIVGTGSGNIFLDTSGSTNVGIGTQAPSSTLHVAGDITGTGLLDVSGVSSLLGNVGVGTSSPNAELDVSGRIRQANAINCGLEADTNGDLICAGTSDINLKTDITALSATSSLSKINQLDGVRFRYLPQANLGSEEELGFLAQDVEKIFPELVGESNGYKFVDYDKLTAVLAEAVQELDSKVTELESGQVSDSTIDDEDAENSSSSEDTDSGGLLASVGAWLSERGVEISDGIARFVEGIFDSLTTSRLAIDNTREEGDDNEDLDPAAGFGEIPTDEDEVEIENNQVATSSQIIVTFTEEINTSYWVEKAVGSFKVRTAEAMSATTSFDYLVVGVEMSEDQLASSTEATTGSDDSQDENDGMTPIDNGSDSDDSTDGAGSRGSDSNSEESEETSTSTDTEDSDGASGTGEEDATATSTATTTDDATETEDSSTSTSTSTESDDPDTEADSGESDPENNDGAGNGTGTTTETDTEADSGSEESTSDTSTEDGSDGSTTDGSGESTEDSGNEEDSGSSDDVDTTDPSEDEAGETSDSGSSDDGSETSS